MDALWASAARYCVRQNAHAFIWLWGLFLILGASALGLRRSTPRFSGVLVFFAICTLGLGIVIFSACSAYAPLSMGLGTSRSATYVTTVMCLGKDAFQTALLWTIVVLSCSAAIGSMLWARLTQTSRRTRIFAIILGVLLIVIAAAAVVLHIFAFSMCATRWVF